MKFHRRTIRCRERLNALQRLEAQLEKPNEAKWYAARLERLGRVIFGDPWDSGEPKATKEQPVNP